MTAPDVTVIRRFHTGWTIAGGPRLPTGDHGGPPSRSLNAASSMAVIAGRWRRRISAGRRRIICRRRGCVIRRRRGRTGDRGANAGADQPASDGGAHIVAVMVITVMVITVVVIIVAVPIIRPRGWSDC